MSGKSATVFVNVVVQNANGGSCNVVVKDFIRMGEMIPEKINMAAAEAAAMAYVGLRSSAHGSDEPIVRDRTGSLVPRTVVGP